MKLIDTKMEEAGINLADGDIGTTYTYYQIKLRFAEFPDIWWKYDTGVGMLTFDKVQEIYAEIQKQVEEE